MLVQSNAAFARLLRVLITYFDIFLLNMLILFIEPFEYNYCIQISIQDTDRRCSCPGIWLILRQTWGFFPEYKVTSEFFLFGRSFNRAEILNTCVFLAKMLSINFGWVVWVKYVNHDKGSLL